MVFLPTKSTRDVGSANVKSEADVIVAWCSCPDEFSAQAIAHLLVEEQLAACVQILPAVSSVYRWRGQVETVTETVIQIKTQARKFAQVEHAISRAHPYDVPELVAVPVTQGSAAYLKWVVQST